MANSTHGRSRSGLSERLLRLAQPRAMPSSLQLSYGYRDQIHKEKLIRENRFYVSANDSHKHSQTPEPVIKSKYYRERSTEEAHGDTAGRFLLSQSTAFPQLRRRQASGTSLQSTSVFAYERVDRKVSRSPSVNPLTGELRDYFNLATNRNPTDSETSPLTERIQRKEAPRYPSVPTRSEISRDIAGAYGMRSDSKSVQLSFPSVNCPPVRKGMGYRLTRGLLC